MSIKAKLIARLGVALAPWLCAVPASANETFSVTSVITVPGNPLASFDISFVDAVAGVYVLADRSNKAIDVVDTATNQVVNQLTADFAGVGGPHGNGPNGVLIANHTHVWVGDGNSKVKVLQLHNSKLLDTIDTGGTMRADELCWDSADHIILIANPDEPLAPTSGPPFTSAPFVTFIDSNTHAILGKIVFDGTHGKPLATGGVEQCQWDQRTGKFYLNVPQANGTPPSAGTDNLVLQIDPVSEAILNKVNVTSTGCKANHGMTIGPAPQIALGCTGASTASVVISDNFGSPGSNTLTVIATLPDETGTDENWFNPGDNHYFFADGSHMTGSTATPQLGVIDALAETGASTAKPVEDLPSPASAIGSHSVAADPVGNKVYVPINNSATGGQLSGICGSHGGSNSKGCIAVFTTTGPDDPGSCFQQGGTFANCPPKGQAAARAHR